MKKFITFLSLVLATQLSFSQGTQILSSPIYYNGLDVGIGYSNPLSKLHVDGSIHLPLSRLVGHNPDGDTFTYDGSSLGNYSLGWYSIPGSAEARFSGRGGIKLFTNELLRLYVDNTGNVGIGTTSPGYKLTVAGAIRADENITVQKQGSYRVAMVGNDHGYLIGRNDSNEDKFLLHSNGNSYINGGNLGIGTSTPNFLLTVGANLNNAYSSSPELASRGIMSHGVGSASANLLLHRDDVTINNQDVLGQIKFTGADGGEQTGAKIQAISKANWSTGNASSALQFATYDNSTSNLVERMTIDDSGNVGIGTTSPGYTLAVKGGPPASKGINIMDTNSRLYFDGRRAMEGHNTQSRLDVGEGFSNMQLFGNVGLGVIAPNEKLEVNGNALIDGNIETQKLTVTTTPGNWPDYVFEPNYKPLTLAETEAFIKTNKHLPEVPSAKEVEEEGQDVGAVQTVLLKKIEEMTLLMIEMNKRLEKLEKENKALKQKKD